MLVRKIAIIWQSSWSLVFNIFRDLCFRIGLFQASVGYKNIAYKRKSVVPQHLGIFEQIKFFSPDPLKRNPTTEKIMQFVDYAFTLIFLFEIILKAISYGFVLGHKNCYLRYISILLFLDSLASIMRSNASSPCQHVSFLIHLNFP